MRRALPLLFVLLLGCISTSQKLADSDYCFNLKEAIAQDFEIYGLSSTSVQGNLGLYCEYYSGKTKVLQLIYSEEPDPEYSYFSKLYSFKLLPGSVSYSEFTKGELSSFYVEAAENGKTTVKAVAFDGSSSVTLTAIYVRGQPNPFASGKLLQKVAVEALSEAQKRI